MGSDNELKRKTFADVEAVLFHLCRKSVVIRRLRLMNQYRKLYSTIVTLSITKDFFETDTKLIQKT